QTCCIDALSKGKPVRLHLRDVSAIDERGRTMLRHLAAEGVDLTANGIYSSYIVGDIQSAGLSKRRCSRLLRCGNGPWRVIWLSTAVFRMCTLDRACFRACAPLASPLRFSTDVPGALRR